MTPQEIEAKIIQLQLQYARIQNIILVLDQKSKNHPDPQIRQNITNGLKKCLPYLQQWQALAGAYPGMDTLMKLDQIFQGLSRELLPLQQYATQP
jgi:hypothetical protein